ncbi:GNAT family N-acetyltransferase [Geodermatophilus normandii]|uniref:GNAT family N-acetyltransferase n=1 Tax=Geodermatophilus normandii TaxID=1137989 RepID=UPI0011B4AC67|nr:GNAT family N-acetyltransferase [Geodermatophilus normandii]
MITARDEGDLVGLLALTVRRRCGLSILSFLGAGPSDYGTILVDPDSPQDQPRILDALLDAARAVVPGSLLDLEQVSDADPVLPLLQDWGRRRGLSVHCRRQSESMQEVFQVERGVPVPPKTRSMRRHGHRTLRLLESLGEVEVLADLLSRVPTRAEVLSLADECAAVDAGHPQAKRRTHPWRGPSGALLRDFLSAAPSSSRWLSGVRVDGRLVAYQLDLVAPSTVATYYASYHADVAPFGVGTYLESQSRVRAAKAGAAQIDFLRGMQPYKLRAANVQHTSYRVQLVPGGVIRGSHGRAVGAALAWRQIVRRHRRLVNGVRRVLRLGPGLPARSCRASAGRRRPVSGTPTHPGDDPPPAA